jgi:hypothetical protein
MKGYGDSHIGIDLQHEQEEFKMVKFKKTVKPVASKVWEMSR